MKVLIACEFSGVVRDAFAAMGHDAWSCDLLETEKPGQHIVGDVLEIIHDGWELMIAHPPCTYLANSGVWALHKDPNRWAMMEAGAKFFRALLDADIERVAIENPVMHGYAVAIVGRKADQTIQPYQFGHPESKRTGLWLRGLPPLRPTNVLEKTGTAWANQTPSGQNKIGPSPDRWRERSRTYEGIAEAMADQWGGEHIEVVRQIEFWKSEVKEAT